MHLGEEETKVWVSLKPGYVPCRCSEDVMAKFRNIAPARIRKFDGYEFLSKWMKILDGRKYLMQS